MKKGFTLIELMAAIATMAVLIAILLPDIQKAKDASLKGTQKEGPFWIYREYEYAGGPVTSEISGSYQHSLQEILDMYAIQISKDQAKNSQELQADAEREARTEEHPALHAESVSTSLRSAPDPVTNPASERVFSKTNRSKEDQIRGIKRGIKNLKIDLSHNHASLSARRNIHSALKELYEDLRILESQP